MCRYLLSMICLSFLLACEQTPEFLMIPAILEQSDLEICNAESCPKITINYLQAEGDAEIAQKINQSIDQFLISSLFLGEDIGQMAESKEKAMEEFINSYRTTKAEFDFSATYEAALDVDEIYQNERLLSLDLKSYLYTGGAHGNGSVYFKNFDKETGEEIAMKALFYNLSSFTDFAEEKFREAYQIPSEGSINATGFWFEEDTFYLPDTIGFNEEGAVIVYNSYDIASYADGPIELTLPWASISNYVSNVYFP
jgi:Deacetylase PdaC/Protein of unknown function (DUF3298)